MSSNECFGSFILRHWNIFKLWNSCLKAKVASERKNRSETHSNSLYTCSSPTGTRPKSKLSPKARHFLKLGILDIMNFRASIPKNIFKSVLKFVVFRFFRRIFGPNPTRPECFGAGSVRSLVTTSPTWKTTTAGYFKWKHKHQANNKSNNNDKKNLTHIHIYTQLRSKEKCGWICFSIFIHHALWHRSLANERPVRVFAIRTYLNRQRNKNYTNTYKYRKQTEQHERNRRRKTERRRSRKVTLCTDLILTEGLYIFILQPPWDYTWQS